MDTVVIPANRVLRAATIMARRDRTASTTMFGATAALLIVAVLSLPSVGSLLTLTAFAAIAGALAIALRRSARRAAEIGARATDDPSLMWLVEDYRLIALDEVGTPMPELAFKISSALRRELTEMPRALLR